MVTVDPASTLVGALFSVNVVAAETPFTLPDWLSFVAGAGLPSESVPWPRAVQALAPAAAVNVQVKSCDAPATSVTLAGVKPPAQPPVPVTFTLVSVSLPVLVSVTTMVTKEPASTLVGALFTVSAVAGATYFLPAGPTSPVRPSFVHRLSATPPIVIVAQAFAVKVPAVLLLIVTWHVSVFPDGVSHVTVPTVPGGVPTNDTVGVPKLTGLAPFGIAVNVMLKVCGVFTSLVAVAGPMVIFASGCELL